jgi:putative FmdB family regulatory protein
MPLYEYECNSCGTRFEKMQPVTAPPLTECLECGSGPIRRIFHPVGVIFKGSGWYITDSRKPAPTSTGTRSEGDGAKSEVKPDTKSEKSGSESTTRSASSED